MPPLPSQFSDNCLTLSRTLPCPHGEDAPGATSGLEEATCAQSWRLPGRRGGRRLSSGGRGPDPDPVIRVGGTYQTAVTLVTNGCPGQTVQQHPTVVGHAPGATAVSLSHAGSTYRGALDADGAFTTPPVTQVFDGICYGISIAGQFTETAIDAMVLVNAARHPPCAFSARWAGPKVGEPNVIP